MNDLESKLCGELFNLSNEVVRIMNNIENGNFSQSDADLRTKAVNVLKGQVVKFYQMVCDASIKNDNDEVLSYMFDISDSLVEELKRRFLQIVKEQIPFENDSRNLYNNARNSLCKKGKKEYATRLEHLKNSIFANWQIAFDSI